MPKIDTSRTAQFLKIVLQAVEDAGGSIKSSDALDSVEKSGDIELSEYELGVLPSGDIRWRNHVNWESLALTKSDWLRKNNGTWSITEDGKKALALTNNVFIERAGEGYKEWERQQKRKKIGDTDDLTSHITVSPTDELDQSIYLVDHMVSEGVFINHQELDRILSRLREKKNLILQGAPGVGKTFVARKLAYAIVGRKDDSKIETVQLHPSYSYEDFIRGYRPTDQAGQFDLRDGPFIRICERAYADSENNYVMVIDEINRGNLSQIFGEMFSLLETDKRGVDYKITPLYRRVNDDDDKVSIPENLYVIGTMNLADRSLALVDYALRRRFAFIHLRPRFQDEMFKNWLDNRKMNPEIITNIIQSMTTLNQRISEDQQLGPEFQIGHSFFIPKGDDYSELDYSWFRGIIDTEIEPLLEEYWFGELDKDKASNTVKDVFGSYRD